MPRSTFYYYLKNLKKEDKYKGKNVTIFEKYENEDYQIKVNNELGPYPL